MEKLIRSYSSYITWHYLIHIKRREASSQPFHLQNGHPGWWPVWQSPVGLIKIIFLSFSLSICLAGWLLVLFMHRCGYLQLISVSDMTTTTASKQASNKWAQPSKPMCCKIISGFSYTMYVYYTYLLLDLFTFWSHKQNIKNCCCCLYLSFSLSLSFFLSFFLSLQHEIMKKHHTYLLSLLWKLFY